jgi:hypothetical protein
MHPGRGSCLACGNRKEYRESKDVVNDDERETLNMGLEGDCMGQLPHPPAPQPLPAPERGYIDRAWGAFYEGNVQQATKDIGQHIKTLENHVSTAHQTWVMHAKTLIDLYALAGTAGRDRMDTSVSLAYLTRAKEEAEHFGDPDLLCVVLLQLFNSYMQFGLYRDAECLKDILMVYVGGCVNLATVGLSYLAGGELYSALWNQHHKEDDDFSSHKYLDMAEIAWRTIGKDSETNHMRFTLSRVLNERSTLLARQKHVQDAKQVLSEAKAALAVGNVRHRKDTYLASSGLNIVNGDVIGACADLQASIQLHKQTNSRSNLVYMYRDVALLERISPSSEEVAAVKQTLLHM